MELIVGQILPYVAVIIFLGGVTWRIWRWMIPQVVHNISLSPFPKSWSQVAVWWVWQLATFANLLKFDRPLWVGAWVMHITLFLILGGHVMGFSTEGTQFYLMTGGFISKEMSKTMSSYLGTSLGLIFLPALVYLLVRRLVVEPVKAISSTSDYLHLLLLIGIATLGNYIRLVPDAHIGYTPVKDYIGGLLFFSPVAMPESTLFVVKYVLVLLLMIIFPFSKLMHVFGFFWERWIVNRPVNEPGVQLPGVKVNL